jgi:hypothetical protein
LSKVKLPKAVKPFEKLPNTSMTTGHRVSEPTMRISE